MKINSNDLAKFVPAVNRNGIKKLLHVGCGSAPASRLPECFKSKDWHEIRLDVDPSVKPDIVANLVDMSAVSTRSIDAVWSSHSIEHLEGFQVPIALSEVARILKPGGFAMITLPDLECIARLIAAGKGNETLYISPAGPITPIDMLFGHQKSIERGNFYMAHRTGFTSKMLASALIRAGFSDVRVTHGKSYDLWAIAVKD